MDINAQIVDQRVSGIMASHADCLPPGSDTNRRKSAAFTILCMSASLGISLSEAAELLTDGGQDAGVDGLHIGDVDDGEFVVTLFQAKYKVNSLEGDAHFPQNGVEKSIGTVQILFDPAKDVVLNSRLKPRIEEVRSLVRDGFIPIVRVILCNNGQRWNDEAQARIEQSSAPAGQTEWLHFNHESIIEILRKPKPVDDSLRFAGNAIVEEFNFRRVLIGKVPVTEIAALFGRNHDTLLQRNIRRYLGMNSTRVNKQIHETLEDPNNRGNFYFFNNGVTIICKKFRHNALQRADYQVRLEDMQVINGGQTCKTIQRTLSQHGLLPVADHSNTFVMVRVYELADDDQDFVRDITYATNSQNPVDLRDLKSNDPLQKQLESGLEQLGQSYRRQREEGPTRPDSITPTTVAEAVLAIWRRRPHQAKFLSREHFGKLYDLIFNDLNAAQALLATRIFRAVEKRRKQSAEDDPPFLQYSSHYIAMIIGSQLLEAHGLTVEALSHRELDAPSDDLSTRFDDYHNKAVARLERALVALYGDHRSVSLQQLSATFRRGDLLEVLASV